MITQKPIWTPTPNENLSIFRLQKIIEFKYNQKFVDYDAFHKWSCENNDIFWEIVWKYCSIVTSQPYKTKFNGKRHSVIDSSRGPDRIPRWFMGARLNYAQNILRRCDDQIAMYYATEEFNAKNNTVQSVTFRHLRMRVQEYAAALRAFGIRSKDKVVSYLPNSVECAIAMFATAALGAVWSVTSVDYGVAAVLDRYVQVEPKLLFVTDSVVYGGKTHLLINKVKEIVRSLPTLQTVVLIPRISTSQPLSEEIPHCVPLSRFLSVGRDSDEIFSPMEFTQVGFHHPLFIMFSSGTTGPAKCMVHSVGGTLLKHAEEHILQECMTEDDILLFWTNTGWMMWNWLMSALITGGSVVLFDGAPMDPNHHVLFDIVQNIGVTMFGIGAKLYSLMEDRGLKPNQTHDLSSLKLVMATGSVLKASSFDYIHNCIKSDVPIGSISGGTDLLGCFMGVSWLKPVYRGECQALYLGMDVETWGSDGKPVVGEPGELVCVKPFPSTPVYFLNDMRGIKYYQSYFSKYRFVWAHGDYCIINPETGGVIMLGRSDGTLNPGGIRFGSAEIYQVVESFPEVEDSICVGQRLPDGDERVILFVKMKNAKDLDDSFVHKLRTAIRTERSPKHVPAIILPVKDIPYTISGKKVEIAVRKLISGQGNITNLDVLRNPESLEFFKNRKELLIPKVSAL